MSGRDLYLQSVAHWSQVRIHIRFAWSSLCKTVSTGPFKTRFFWQENQKPSKLQDVYRSILPVFFPPPRLSKWWSKIPPRTSDPIPLTCRGNPGRTENQNRYKSLNWTSGLVLAMDCLQSNQMSTLSGFQIPQSRSGEGIISMHKPRVNPGIVFFLVLSGQWIYCCVALKTTNWWRV